MTDKQSNWPNNQPSESGAGREPANPARLERALDHLEKVEHQLSQVRKGLMHSHRLTTMGTLATMIAHELNNIFTPMVSYAQLALGAEEGQEDVALMRKALKKNLEGAERAAKIASSVLGFAGRSDHNEPANVRQVVEEAVSCMARPPEKDRIELAVDVPDVRVAMPPLQLQQVLVNIILNACKAMRSQKRGGHLTVTGSRRRGGLVLDVADTGPGVPEEIRADLFEPFVTRGAGDADEGGTGLGLAICRDLVGQAGGEISFESESGKGTVFHLVLPLAEEQQGAAAA